MAKNIKILGSGPSLHSYKRDESDIIWCPLSMKHKSIDINVEHYFALHDHETTEDSRVITADDYPLYKIIDKFNSRYFTNTVSYMIAYAIYEGVDSIDIYGVDMSGAGEYVNQRGSLMYWIGRAESMGIKVTMANGIMDPVFLYGLEEEKKKKLRVIIGNISAWAQSEMMATDNQRERDQYAGIAYGMELIDKEL